MIKHAKQNFILMQPLTTYMACLTYLACQKSQIKHSEKVSMETDLILPEINVEHRYKPNRGIGYAVMVNIAEKAAPLKQCENRLVYMVWPSILIHDHVTIYVQYLTSRTDSTKQMRVGNTQLQENRSTSRMRQQHCIWPHTSTNTKTMKETV